MSELNLLLLEGFIYCPKCLAQIPQCFLTCPSCAGLVTEEGRWVAPARLPQPEPKEQQIWLFADTQEYPA